jgi:hypothetical protein
MKLVPSQFPDHPSLPIRCPFSRILLNIDCPKILYEPPHSAPHWTALIFKGELVWQIKNYNSSKQALVMMD